MNGLKLFFLIFLSGFLTCGLQGQEREDLLFQEIPVVVTSSRKYQPATESPSTVTVISSDDIKYSGAETVPDALRMVAGVDVMNLTLRDQQVGVRGFNGFQSNKLLVMIDGFSVYEDLYGSVFWDFLPITMDEIKQIEIVRSPVSTLYGANAFSGVINIITKSPEDINGGSVDAFLGNLDSASIGVLYGYTGDAVDVKVAGSWERAGDWGNNGLISDVFKGSLMLGMDLGDNTRLQIYGARVNSDPRLVNVGVGFGGGHMAGDSAYFQARLQTGKFVLKGKYSSFNVEGLLPNVSNAFVGERRTWDLELLHTVNLWKRSSLVWGMNLIYNEIPTATILGEKRNQTLWGLFAEQDVELSDKVRVTLGARYDQHPLVKGHLSPRGSLFIKMGKNSVLRASVAQAFHNPAFINSYMHIQYILKVPVAWGAPDMDIPVVYETVGNEDLKPEKVTAYEIGFSSRAGNRLKYSLNIFYNRYKDFIETEYILDFPAESNIPGVPVGLIPGKVTSHFINRGKAWSIGGEFESEVKINSWLSGFFNYSLQRIVREYDNPYTNSYNEKGKRDKAFPLHKINAGIKGKLNRYLAGGLFMHWVSKTQRISSVFPGQPEIVETTGAYCTLNGSIYYSPFLTIPLEFRMTFHNLLNNRHYEYYRDVRGENDGSQELGRKIMFGIKYSF